MNEKQKKFCDYYLQSGNATEAATKAGYSKKTAYAIGSENLKKPKILEYIAERQKQAESKRIADITEVMEFFTASMRGEVRDQFDLDPSLADRQNAAKELMKRYQIVESNAKDDDEMKDALQQLDDALKRFGGVVGG